MGPRKHARQLRDFPARDFLRRISACFTASAFAMDNRAVADRDPVADEARKIVGKVQHGVVLNVGVVADDDAADVAAQHCGIGRLTASATLSTLSHNSQFPFAHGGTPVCSRTKRPRILWREGRIRSEALTQDVP